MSTDIKEYTNSELVRQLGKRFKEYRLRYNKTQKEVAEHAGLSIPTVGAFENGTATSLSLKSFVRLLRTLDELEQLNNFLPPIPMSPSLLLKLQKREKRRASRNKSL